MEYNKNQFQKTNDKKILHKIGKHWFSISLSTLMAIGGMTAVQQSSPVHADVNQGQSRNQTTSAVSQKQSNASVSLKSASANSVASNQNVVTSQNPKVISSHASNLYAQILNNSVRKQMASGSSAIKPVAVAKPNNVSVPSTNSDGITVKYMDQKQHVVKTGTINSRPAGSKIDVIDPNDGGISMPSPSYYDLDPNQDPNYTFQKGTHQTAIFNVTGRQVPFTVTIDRNIKHLDGSFTHDTYSIRERGRVGDTIDIQPGDQENGDHDYVNPTPPANPNDASDNYYPDPMDHSYTNQTIMPPDAQHSSPYIAKSPIPYQYDEEKRQVTLGQVTVHYKDVNNPFGPDVAGGTLVFKGNLGKPVDMQSLEANSPYTWYFAKVPTDHNPIPKTYTRNPQDVVILVHQIVYIKAHLLFEDVDHNNQVVGRKVMLGTQKSQGQKIDYHKYVNAYMPLNYKFVSLKKGDDPYLKAGDDDVVYVEPGKQTNQGQIMVNYYLNGDRSKDPVYTKTWTGNLNDGFSWTRYISSDYFNTVPELKDYKPDPVGTRHSPIMDGSDVSQYTVDTQNIDIAVSRKPQPKQQSATVYLDYCDVNNPDKVLKTVSDPGTANQPVDYTKYETSAYLPSGYKFDSLSNPNATFENGQHYKILVKKNGSSDKKQATVYMDYVLPTNMSHVIQELSDQGQAGSTINYGPYETTKVPKGYKFMNLGNSSLQFVNGAHEQILVQKVPNQPSDNPQPKPSDNPQQVTGKIVYKDNETGQQVGSDITIKGAEDSSIDYNKYTNNGSQYMPSGYHYDKLATGTGTFLEPNATYTIMISKNKPNQPQTVNTEVYYLDAKTRNKVGQAPLSGQAGTNVDYGPYKVSPDMPSGYHFDQVSPDSGTKLESGGDYVILVDANAVTDNVIYKNVANGQQIGSDMKITGDQGSNVNLSGYEVNSPHIPQGYEFDHAASNNPTTFANGNNFVIYLRSTKNPNPNPKEINGTLNYVDGSGKVIKLMPISGKQGDGVPYNQYTSASDIPSGYHYVGLGKDASGIFEPNAHYTVVVAKNVVPKPQVTDNVIYKNVANGQQIGPDMTITGNQGSDVDLSGFEINSSHMPKGYVFDHTDPNNPLTYKAGANFVIYVKSTSNPNPNPKEITGTLNYVDEAGKVIKPMTIQGKQGYGVPYGQYINSSDMPKGYFFLRLGQNASGIFEPNAHYTIVVAKDVRPNGNITLINGILNYQDVQTGKIVKDFGIMGNKGAVVPYGQYESGSYLPSGYHFVKVADNASQNFEPNGNYTLMVAKNNPNSNWVIGTLNYIDPSNHQVVKHMPIFGQQGNLVDYGKYMSANNMPKGYHFDSVDAKSNSKFEPNGTYIMYVSPDNQNNNQINGTLNYQDTNTGKIIKTLNIHGNKGSWVPYGNYENSANLPSGYHFVKVASNANGTFEPNGNYTIMVAADTNPNNQSNKVNGTLNYRDPQGKIIKSVPISGNKGDNVNYSQYMQTGDLPNGYHLVGVTQGSSMTYQPNGNYSITVAANPSNNNNNNNNNNHNNGGNNNGGNGNNNNGQNGGNHNNGGNQNTNGNGNRGTGTNGKSGNNQPINLDNQGESSNRQMPRTGEEDITMASVAAALLLMSVSLDALGIVIRRHYVD